jgi:fructose transport system permease protein
MKLPPFIVTLGTWQIILATTFLYSANVTIRAQDIEASTPLLQFFANTVQDRRGRGRARRATFHLRRGLHAAADRGAVLRAAVHRLGAARLRRGRRPGRGAAVRRERQGDADLGLCAFGPHLRLRGLGADRADRLGLPHLGRRAQHPVDHRRGDRGISLFGGRGSIWGALFGALIVGVFSLGLRLLGVDPQWTFFFIGVLIIVAVAVDQWIRRVAA